MIDFLPANYSTGDGVGQGGEIRQRQPYNASGRCNGNLHLPASVFSYL